jgi:hypothetical protein
MGLAGLRGPRPAVPARPENLRGHVPRFPDALGEMTTGEAELLVHVLAHLAAGMRG